MRPDPHDPVLQRFAASLARRPYCKKAKKDPILIRDRSTALSYPYVQLNRRLVRYLVFDIDRRDGAAAWLLDQLGGRFQLLLYVERAADADMGALAELKTAIPVEPVLVTAVPEQVPPRSIPLPCVWRLKPSVKPLFRLTNVEGAINRMRNEIFGTAE